MLRRGLRLFHRWAGLAMAGFLLIAALTGSLLVFYGELERALNPQLFAPHREGAVMLDPGVIAQAIEARLPQVRVASVYMRGSQGASYAMVQPRADAQGQVQPLDFDQLLFDPYSGAELGRRQFGAISQGSVNLMSFLYQLHHNLALGETGRWVMGIVALAWTLDCFAALLLTLPRRARGDFLRRWAPAWKLKWPAKPARINFDLHRAGGLWPWALLLALAWSSVYMNLWDAVYTPVTRLFLDYRAPWTEIAARAEPLAAPRLNWREASRLAREALARETGARGVDAGGIDYLRLNRKLGVYQLQARSGRDIQDRGGMTRLAIDADSGALRYFALPTGHYSGNTVTAWLYALHMGNVFGMTYRILLCAAGILIALLTVTGVLIWARKRGALRARPRQAQGPMPYVRQSQPL